MAFIRPSLVLQAALKPADFTADNAKEIKRSYLFIAQSAVKEQEPEDAAEGNVMQLRIRMMKPYWDTADAAANELWDAVMPKWLRNQMVNVTTAMRQFNTVHHTGAATNLAYDWVDMEFNDHALIRVKTNEDNTVSADVASIASRVRRLMGEGAFGEEKPQVIRVPSRASIAAQKAEYEALCAQIREANARAQAADAAARAAEEEAVDEEAAAIEAAVAEFAEEHQEALVASMDTEGAEEIVLEAPAAGTAEVVVDFVHGTVGGTEDLPDDEDDADDTGAALDYTPIPPFTLDYSVWALEYADGRVVEFDSAQA